MRRNFLDMRWSAAAGVLVGLLLSFVVPTQVLSLYDALFPVVTLKAEVVQKMPSEIVVRLSGQKNRDCRYLGIDAFSRVGTLLRDINRLEDLRGQLRALLAQLDVGAHAALDLEQADFSKLKKNNDDFDHAQSLSGATVALVACSSQAHGTRAYHNAGGDA